MIRIKSPLSFKHNILKKKASGFRVSGQYKQIIQKYRKKLSNEFKSRKLKKRFFRTSWIFNINNFLKENNLYYSYFIHSLKKNKIVLNRKVLFFILILDKI